MTTQAILGLPRGVSIQCRLRNREVLAAALARVGRHGPPDYGEEELPTRPRAMHFIGTSRGFGRRVGPVFQTLRPLRAGISKKPRLLGSSPEPALRSNETEDIRGPSRLDET